MTKGSIPWRHGVTGIITLFGQANHQLHRHLVEVIELVGKSQNYPNPDLLIQEMHLQKI
jgi:hypothetical protein